MVGSDNQFSVDFSSYMVVPAAISSLNSTRTQVLLKMVEGKDGNGKYLN